MKIKQLHLENYGRFGDLTIEFAPTKEKRGNVTLIVGNNGEGKSQVLKALDECLDYLFMSFLHRDDGYVPLLNLKNHANQVTVSVSAEHLGFVEKRKTWNKDIIQFELSLQNERNHTSRIEFDADSFLKSLEYEQKINSHASLPLGVYYPVERLGLSNLPAIEKDKERDYLDKNSYEFVLNVDVDFESFLYWFKNAEDVENADIRRALDRAIQKSQRENIPLETLMRYNAPQKLDQ